MAERDAADRRGRSERGRQGLLERDPALAAIEAVLGRAQQGSGEALLIEAHAGMGKTRLHEAAMDAARERELRILRAAGAELEQDFAFGVAGRLIRALLGDLPAPEHASLLAAAPKAVRSLAESLDAPADVASGGDLALSHGLFAVIGAAAELRPMLLAIDDLHWCDGASLEFLLYLLHRVDELPAALVLTRRPGPTNEVCDRIATHPRMRIERPAPLSAAAVAKLIRRALGDRGDASLVETCLEMTAGNPFYLHELLLALADEGDLTPAELDRHARSLAPDAVTRTLRVRVGRLGPAAAALAQAVAILGDDVELRHAARLAGLELGEAAVAADALGQVEVLFAREPLRFAHALVRRAVDRDIPPAERASRHLEAARVLHEEGAESERVAAQLLLGRAEGDPWVVERLRAAARDARARSVPISAVRYLDRALAEPPGAQVRSAVLAELGLAEAAAGLPSAAAHLAEAAARSTEPRRRAELALERGRALSAQGRHEQAAEAFEEGRAALAPDPADPGERELHDELQGGFVVTASLVPSLQARALERSAQELRRAQGRPLTQGQRLVLAQSALHASFQGQPASSVVELAMRAWDAGRLLEQGTAVGSGWRLVTSALCLGGELERAVELSDAVIEDARRRGLPLAFATASYVRALPQLWRGDVDAALGDLEFALDARRYGWREMARAAGALYALCLVEKGEHDRAEAALTEAGPLGDPGDLEDALRTYCLAELRLAQGRPLDALDCALAAGDIVERTVRFYGYCPWRTAAAQAALALGQSERALELARDARERAERTGVLHLRIRTMRVLGMCEQRLETLRAAVELGERSPPRLETIRSLVELGAALRRENQRTEARRPLQQAADLARAAGASALRERALAELAASGARPRREAFLRGPESLTPSERKIAELAAEGRSNREIAHMLFVTPKTVEYHLRNAYRKLEIESRRELSQALSI